MKRGNMISAQTGLYHGLRNALTVMFIIAIFAAVFPSKVLCTEFSSLPPLYEAALKFSPGHLVTESAKDDKHFVFLNQLLVIDELILKQKKMLRCPPIDLWLICQQVKLLYEAKGKTIKVLSEAKLECKRFQPLDILVALEIVDDLLFVQKDVREFLYYFLTRYKEPCKIDFPCRVDSLVDDQTKLLKETKETLLECFQTIDP